ncbi:TPA: ATPase [Escherichia coli]|nr:ATPase [Escherichia coli]
MPHSYAEYHHFIMMSLMSGEHNTLALSLQDESPWSGACGLMLQQS